MNLLFAHPLRIGKEKDKEEKVPEVCPSRASLTIDPKA